MNALVERIIGVRNMIAGLEAAPRPDRDLIMRQSIFLNGLETAAELVLGPDDLGALGAQSEGDANPYWWPCGCLINKASAHRAGCPDGARGSER